MEMFQHVVVTVVALAAGTVLGRRVFGFVGPRSTKAGCAGCPSAPGACGAATQATSAAAVPHRAVLIRGSEQARSQPPRTP